MVMLVVAVCMALLNTSICLMCNYRFNVYLDTKYIRRDSRYIGSIDGRPVVLLQFYFPEILTAMYHQHRASDL